MKQYKKELELGDTFDLVIIGAMLGTGSKTNLLNSFVLATYNEVTQTYETLCTV